MSDMDLYGKTYHYDNWYESPISLSFVNVLQIGEMIMETDYQISAHNQVCNEITYIVSGKGKVIKNNVQSPVCTGSIQIVSKNDTHAIIADKYEKLRYVYLGFEFNELSQQSKEFDALKNFYNNSITNLLFDDNKTRDYFTGLLNEIAKKMSYDSIMINSYVNQILVHIFRLNSPNTDSMNATINDEQSKNIVGHAAFAVIRYIDDNLLKIENINDIAKNLGYSYTYISHLFKDKVGITLQTYINNAKVDLSLEMLKDKKNTIAQISERLNYQTIQSFSKMFKKRVGCSPSEYRKSIKKNNI